MKQCRLCGQIKRYEDFYSMPGNLDGVRGECKSCFDYKRTKSSVVSRLKLIIKSELSMAPYRALIRMLQEDVELVYYIKSSNKSKYHRYLTEERISIVMDIKRRSYMGRKKKSVVPHEEVWNEILPTLDFMPGLNEDEGLSG